MSKNNARKAPAKAIFSKNAANPGKPTQSVVAEKSFASPPPIMFRANKINPTMSAPIDNISDSKTAVGVGNKNTAPAKKLTTSKVETQFGILNSYRSLKAAIIKAAG